MKKITGIFVLAFLLVALTLVPFQAARAKGLLDGGPIFGGNFTLKSGETLNADLPVFGGSVTIEKGATLNGAIVVMGGSVTVDGTVSKDVVVMGGSATVDGDIAKNVVVFGGAVKLGTDAHIHGNLVTAGAPVDRAEGARVDGDVVNNPSQPSASIGTIGVKDFIIPSAYPGFFDPIWGTVTLFGWSLLLGLLATVVALFLPEHIVRVGTAAVSRTAQAGGWGLLTVVLAPIVLLLMLITVLLIPVAGIAGIILGAAFVFGWIGLGMEIGLRASKAFNLDGPLPLVAGIGTFLLTLVADGIKLFPCVGWLVPSVIAIIGLGAVFMTRFGSRSGLVSPVPAPPAASDSGAETP